MTVRIIVLFVAAVMALPGTASAKGPIQSVEVCGADRCKEITAAFDVERYRHSLFGSTWPASAPHGAGYYRVLVKVVDGTGGRVDGWEFLFAPEARAVLPQQDGTGSQQWLRLRASRSAALQAAVWDLRPLPASSLRAAVRGEPPRPRVVEVVQPAARDAVLRPSAAQAITVLATLLLLAAVGVGVVRLRRARGGRISAPGRG